MRQCLSCTRVMQTWSISYTADRHKSAKKWLTGSLNYNKATGVAHFYSEEGELIEQLKACGKERIVEDAQLELKRHIVEIGCLQGEEESVDDLFTRLNQELGIETRKSIRVSPVSASTNASVGAISKANSKPIAISKIPTKLDEVDVKGYISCDFLYTKDKHKKSKIWHDGILKYYPAKKLVEFWDDAGTLLHKKIMNTVSTGDLFETSTLIIEITGEVRTEDMENDAGEANDEGKEAEKNKENKPIPSIKPPYKRAIPSTAPTHGSIQSTQSTPDTPSNGKRRFDLIFTADKHKKNVKKWIDGWVEWTESTGSAVFFNDDGECFYKKIVAKGQIAEDAEFESGQYLFQIGVETTKNDLPMTESNAVMTPTRTMPMKKPLSPAATTLTAKKQKVNQSIMASQSVPLTGRSDTELLSLLRASNPE